MSTLAIADIIKQKNKNTYIIKKNSLLILWSWTPNYFVFNSCVFLCDISCCEDKMSESAAAAPTADSFKVFSTLNFLITDTVLLRVNKKLILVIDKFHCRP